MILSRYMFLKKSEKFTSADVIVACPGAGRSALLEALKKLTEENIIVKSGNGRSTYYVRSDAGQQALCKARLPHVRRNKVKNKLEASIH